MPSFFSGGKDHRQNPDKLDGSGATNISATTTGQTCYCHFSRAEQVISRTEFRSCVKVEVAVLGFRPNEPYGFRGRKATLNRASALVTVCP